ncbi:MAG: hypothetical protein IPJ75_00855 [Ignavibacteriales bacterium]|nr:hypothetical protein [Ignavibacteriales bacterium]
MGFSAMIDILGSTIIGSIIFLILLRINDAATQSTYTYMGDVIVQGNLVATIQIIEHDFRKIGYCSSYSKIPDPSKAILIADSNRIKFITDIYPHNGVVDTLEYRTGPTSELTETPNARDMYLYRNVNNVSAKGSNLGITQFKLLYFNTLGNKLATPVAIPSEIATIQIDVTVENVAAYNNQYSTAFWRQLRLTARNLKNR